MIQANQLIIGNLVECFGTREIIAIKKHKIKVQHKSKYGNFIIEWCPITSLSLKPISLTEEWLLKLGFKEISFTQDRNRDWYKMFEIDDTSEVVSLNYYTKTNYCRFNFDIGYGNKYVDLYYAHQLQNLYFALTNKELTL